MVRTIGILVLAVLAAGCGDEVVTDDGGTAAAPEALGEAVDLLRSFPTQTSGGFHEPVQRIVRDDPTLRETWSKAWSHRTPVPGPPTVDWTKEMVAFVGIGDQPTAGHGIQIVGAREADGKLLVLVMKTEPEEGAMHAQVVTQPWHAVVLTRSDLPVEWTPYVPPAQRPGAGQPKAPETPAPAEDE